MSVWTALVIVQALSSPTNGIGGPTDRAIGIETATYVDTPVVTTLSFPDRAMCQEAIDVLKKQSGVYSVSCVQTQ